MPYNIKETIFAPRAYLVWRKEIEIKNIANQAMWQSAFEKVHAYIHKNNIKITGPGAALYFKWDEAAGKCELGIGNAVEGVTEVDDSELSLVPVAESNAAMATVYGDYDRLMDAHGAVMAYLQERNLAPTLTIEEYAVMGMDKPDPKDWETNVYYLHN